MFFFNDTATTEIYTLSLHDALPILHFAGRAGARAAGRVEEHVVERRVAREALPLTQVGLESGRSALLHDPATVDDRQRSEEHTSELQSRQYLVCRLLLEKKKLP